MKDRNILHYVLTFVTLLTLLLSTTLSSAQGTIQPAASQASSSTASGPANSPWPMYQHDAQRTSRSPYVGPGQPYLKWHYSISPSSGSSPSIAPDGTLYVGGIDEQFHAIRPDGTSKWTYAVPSRIGGSPAIADDGAVYVGHEDYSTGSLMAFNPDGSLEWSYPARGVRSSPAIAPDGTIYVGASNARLYAINPDGSLKWEYQPGFKESYSSPAIGSDGTIYVAGCKERNIHAVNPDGTTKWTYPIGTTGDTISSPTIDSDGTIYIGGSDNKLYALNPDGTLKWSYPAGDLYNQQQSAAIGPSGTVYVITTEGTLYAFTPAGDVKWTYSIGAGEIKTTPTVDANGTIYFGARNGKVYAINPDGSEKWTFQTPADALGSTIAINSDGTLYVSGSEGVYAIGEGYDFKVEDVWWSPATPVAMSDSTIYVRVRNVGTVYAPTTGEYAVGVRLTDTDAEPDDYWYYRFPGSGIPALQSNELWTLSITSFWFTRPQVDQIQVTFFPTDGDTNIADNMRTEDITIEPASESLLDCLSLLLDTVVVYAATHGISISALQEISTEFILTLGKVGEAVVKGDWDKAWDEIIAFVVKSGAAIWADLGIYPARVAITLVKGFISAAFNAWHCGSALADVIIGLIDDFNAKGADINGAFAESPVYVLITNSSNQRVGFLDDGTVVNEVADAEVIQSSDGRKIALYPGRDTESVLVTGSGSGNFDLTLAIAKPDGSTHNVEYRNISVSADTVGTIDATNTTYLLELDDDGNGTVDRTESPSDITVHWPGMLYLPLVLRNP
jgi:outer membrane protein assembly factor BamB